MKKRFLLICLIAAMPMIVFGQPKGNTNQIKTCKISGIIRYFHNKYIGYKPDVGAEIYFVDKKVFDTIIDIEIATEYYDLASAAMGYRVAINGNEYLGGDFTQSIRNIYGFSQLNEAKLDKLDVTFYQMFILWKEKYDKTEPKYRTYIDASSSYEIEIPYGHYYVVIISGNRNRGIVLSEFAHRHYIKEFEAKENTNVLSYDFEL